MWFCFSKAVVVFEADSEEIITGDSEGFCTRRVVQWISWLIRGLIVFIKPFFRIIKEIDGLTILLYPTQRARGRQSIFLKDQQLSPLFTLAYESLSIVE